MNQGDRGIAGRTLGLGFQPTGADFSDSLYNVTSIVNGFPVSRPNALGVLRFSVGRGCTRIVVFCPNNVFGITTTDDELSMYVDGTWLASGDPTAEGMAGYVFSLDGAPHTIEIYSPYQQYDATTVGNIIGSFIYHVQCYGGQVTLLPNPSVSKRTTVYGDSISDAALAAPDSKNGWIPLLRQAGTAGRISLEGWGGRALWDDSGNPGGYGFPSLTDLALRLVQLGFSSATQHIWDAMGYNDYSPGFDHWSASDYGAACATLYDAIHGFNPAIAVFAQTLLITGSEGTANGFGNVPADYRAAKTAAATGRSWVTLVDGTTLMPSSDLSGDGIHPTTAGHALLATNIGAIV